MNSKLTIVLGAGASKEFGFPTGYELKSEIAHLSNIRFDDSGFKLVSGDSKLVSTLRDLASENPERSINLNYYIHVARTIKVNMPIAPSIDNFLDTHKDNALLVEFGKIAITLALLEAEKRCDLWFDWRKAADTINYSKVSETWLGHLFQILVAQRDFDSFLEALDQISFISFNYDRCVHQYFLLASQQYFSLQQKDVELVHSKLHVMYPYGSVGGNSPAQMGVSGFGEPVYGNQLITRSRNIRTFTEGAASSDLTSIQGALEKADVLMFLGFGFLPLNMDFLFNGIENLNAKIFATTKGISSNNVNELRLSFSNLFAKLHKSLSVGERLAEGVSLENCTCGELVSDNSRYLSKLISG